MESLPALLIVVIEQLVSSSRTGSRTEKRLSINDVKREGGGGYQNLGQMMGSCVNLVLARGRGGYKYQKCS